MKIMRILENIDRSIGLLTNSLYYVQNYEFTGEDMKNITDSIIALIDKRKELCEYYFSLKNKEADINE